MDGKQTTAQHEHQFFKPFAHKDRGGSKVAHLNVLRQT
jgi:hypothetical protein